MSDEIFERLKQEIIAQFEVWLCSYLLSNNINSYVKSVEVSIFLCYSLQFNHLLSYINSNYHSLQYINHLADSILLTYSLYEEFETFKSQSANLIYDYYFPHKLEWPASCCRWVSNSLNKNFSDNRVKWNSHQGNTAIKMCTLGVEQMADM